MDGVVAQLLRPYVSTATDECRIRRSGLNTLASSLGSRRPKRKPEDSLVDGGDEDLPWDVVEKFILGNVVGADPTRVKTYLQQPLVIDIEDDDEIDSASRHMSNMQHLVDTLKVENAQLKRKKYGLAATLAASCSNNSTIRLIRPILWP